MGGLDALRLGRPAQGEVRGDPEGLLPCGKVDELPQGDPAVYKLKPSARRRVRYSVRAVCNGLIPHLLARAEASAPKAA